MCNLLSSLFFPLSQTFYLTFLLCEKLALGFPWRNLDGDAWSIYVCLVCLFCLFVFFLLSLFYSLIERLIFNCRNYWSIYYHVLFYFYLTILASHFFYFLLSLLLLNLVDWKWLQLVFPLLVWYYTL